MAHWHAPISFHLLSRHQSWLLLERICSSLWLFLLRLHRQQAPMLICNVLAVICVRLVFNEVGSFLWNVNAISLVVKDSLFKVLFLGSFSFGHAFSITIAIFFALGQTRQTLESVLTLAFGLLVERFTLDLKSIRVDYKREKEAVMMSQIDLAKLIDSIDCSNYI